MSSLHAWMYRFAFPGFAETEWVLPAGVDHEEPWYGPLPAVMAVQDLLEWSLDPYLESKLRDLHEATFGEALLEAPGVPFHALVGALREAFERGNLVAWALRSTGVRSPGELPKVEPKPRPGAKATTWIEIVLVDQTGAPVPGETYRVTPSDGVMRRGTLDERGSARVEGIESGPCDVGFPSLDGREWSAIGPSRDGDLREASAAFTHRVRANECLSSIAAAHRFRSWKTVHENDLNGDLRALRPDPNVLAEGDVVWIDRYERVELRPTGARHRFETVTTRTALRLRLERMKPSRYVLSVDGETFDRSFPESRLIEHPIPASARSAELRLFFDDAPEPYQLTWRLDLGMLRPVDRVRGVKERLNNLGFVAGPENEDLDVSTHTAVAAFQKAHGDPPTGALDDALREQVRTKHDVG